MVMISEVDRELNLQLNKEQLSEAVTAMAQSYNYLSFDEFYVIKDITLLTDDIIVTGDVEKILRN